jgi:hypothetical protein
LKKFEVYIMEQYRKTVFIEAESKEEALQKAENGEGEITTYKTLDFDSEVTEL